MDARQERSDSWDQTAWQLVLWMGLLVAFSPVLLDLFSHAVENPWARSSLVFPFLAWFAAGQRDASKTPEHSRKSSRMMWFWLLLGLAIELFAVAGGAIRFGRIGILVAIVGLCHGMGWMRIGVGVLLVWALPLPKNLIELFSPFMQAFMGQVAAALVPGLSLENQAPLPILRAANAQLPLASTDSGVALIYGMAGLGWYNAVSSGRRMREVAAHSLCWAFTAVPIQIALVICAGVLLRWAGEVSGPQIVLTNSHWIIVVGIGCTLILRKMIWTNRRKAIEAGQ